MEGYEVTAVGSGSDALRAIREQSFDLLLSDLRIDDVDGLTLLAAAQKRDPETVSILLTGYASLESAVQALRYGAFNYLLKPCNIDEMKLTISRGLEKKRLSEALRERVIELEQANQTIRTFSSQLEDKVKAATAELADRVQDLQESRGRLDAVIDSMKDGLIVYGRDGRHRHGAAAPIPAAVEVLPNVFDPLRVPPDQERTNVVLQIRRHGQLAAIDRRVADALDPVARRQAKRDEIAPRAGDDDLSSIDFHFISNRWFVLSRDSQ